MVDSTAIEDFELPWRRRPSSAPAAALHLVIVWSLEEPERVGEAAALEEGALLGRGEPDDDERTARLRFRPTRSVETTGGWLEASRLSRAQLRFHEVSGEQAVVESVGRCPLSVNGSPVMRAS